MGACGHTSSSENYSETITLADLNEADDDWIDEDFDNPDDSGQALDGHDSALPESIAEADSDAARTDASPATPDKKNAQDNGQDNSKNSGNPAPQPQKMQPDGMKPLPVMLERPADPNKKEKIVYNIPRGSIRVKNIGRLADVFNDSNYQQLAHAERLGIRPVSSLRSLYRNRRPLVKVTTNKDFMVEELTHSYPFLVPEASKLLHDIGKNFSDSVAARGGGKYRIIVTSVLRTPATVKRLKRVNGNAVEQSTHQYGTTFDITYNRFDSPADGKTVASEDMKNILAEVIHNLRAQGRCLVKFERKSPCFHITVTK